MTKSRVADQRNPTTTATLLQDESIPRRPSVMAQLFGTCGPMVALVMAILVAAMLYGNPNNLDSTSILSSGEKDNVSSQQQQQQQTRFATPQCKNPSGLIGDSSCCDYETAQKLNLDFTSKLHEIVDMPFFRYFKVNLYKECPYWGGALLCMNQDCSVETMDKNKVPEQWKTPHHEKLSKVSMPMNPLFGSHPPKPLLKDQDFCVPVDTGDEGVYVDLKENPERFTGYSGPSAAMVWKAIYEENCFDVSQEMTASCHYCQSEREKLRKAKENDHHDHTHYKKMTSLEHEREDSALAPPETLPMDQIGEPSQEEMEGIFSRLPKDTSELQKLVNGITEGGKGDGKGLDGGEESCLEKRVYYRLISGLHSSISIHICDEWFNATTGEWGPNLDCFISRVGMHPERLENIYFDYVVMLRAVSKISDFLAGYEFCTGEESLDRDILKRVNELVALVKKCPPTFDEKLLFQEQKEGGVLGGGKGGQIKRLKNQFRDHFRNVTRIMDCVGCEKCRLWGKIQTLGLGTALKILFSYDDASLKGKNADGVLTRSEIVALINTFNRLSESVSAIDRFGVLYRERLEQEQAQSMGTASKEQQQQQQSAFIRAPTKEEDDQDTIVYKVWWKRARQQVKDAYHQLDSVLESKNITQHRAALRNLASWIPQ